MSKIFSALKKAQGELASIASPFIALVEGSRSEETPPTLEPGQVPVEESPAPAVGGVVIGNRGQTASEHTDSSSELRPAQAPIAAPSLVVFGSRHSNEGSDSSSDLRNVPVQEVRIAAETRIVLLTDPRSPGADRFRYLRMRLRELAESAKVRTLVITSPLPRDGKSTVAMNLATALAEGGKRTVLLIEGDMYNPTLSKTLGVQARTGLAECLEGSLDPIPALQRIEPLGWYLLQAGATRKNPTELLQSDSLSTLMQKLSAHFDWILIDTPPVAPLSDALILSRQADAVLMVVRAERTPREAVQDALALLGPKKVLGIVFNGAQKLNRLYSQYSEYYAKK